MNLPLLSDFNFQGKKVLVRCDFDVPVENGIIVDDSRIKECLPTIQYLLEQNASEVILLGHLGRPEGKAVEEFSLKPVAERLNKLLNLQFQVSNFQLGNFSAFKIKVNVYLLENLRFDKGEEENDEGFARELAGLGDFYVNEAFAVSHREHASIVGVPKFLPHCTGLHFTSEVENLSRVLEKPEKPLVFVIGGAKPETKLVYIEDFSRIVNTVLAGGILVRERDRVRVRENIIFANLTDDGFDINEESIKEFADIIKNAGTIVWNGPMGKYEVPEGQEGTRRVGEAIANSFAFKVVGGGDTITALKKFNLIDKMDYVSTGGGAMLEFLAKGTLPGIKVLINK